MFKKIPENLIENNFLNLIFGKKHRFNCNQIKTNNTRKKLTDPTIKFLLIFLIALNIMNFFILFSVFFKT